MRAASLFVAAPAAVTAPAARPRVSLDDVGEALYAALSLDDGLPPALAGKVTGMLLEHGGRRGCARYCSLFGWFAV